MAKSSPRWQQVTGSSLPLDAFGWPAADFEWVIDFRRNKPWNGPDFDGSNGIDVAGTYPLTFRGQATLVDASGAPTTAITFANQTFSAQTNMTTVDVIFADFNWLFIIGFHITTRPGQSSNTGLTDIQMVLPGYSLGTTQLFTDRFVSLIKQMNPASFRSFDTGINGYEIWDGTSLVNNTWADRSLPSDAYWPLASRNSGNVSGLGMPWEYYMQISLQTNTPGWYCMPVGADDDYIRNLALLLKNGNSFTAALDPSVPFYIEFSNEVWNFQFSQYIYNAVMAKKNNVSVIQNYVNRAFEISNIFRQVFGDAAMGSIVRVVCLWQYSNWIPMQAALQQAQITFGAPVNYFIWGIGEAPYLSPTESGTVPYSNELDPTGVDRIMDTFYTAAGARRQAFTAWQTIATYYGIGVVGYEAGPSLVAGIEGEVARSDRMKDFIYRYFMENYFATGAATVNYFALGPGEPSSYGDWYLFEHWYNQSDSKLQGFLATSGQPMPTPVVGYVLPWDPSQNASIDVSQYTAPQGWGTPPSVSGVNICPTGCWPFPDFVSYLLRAPAAGTYQILIKGSTNDAGGSVNVLLDNELVQTVAFPTQSEDGNVTVAVKVATPGLHTLAFTSASGVTSFRAGDDGIVIQAVGSAGTAIVPSAPLNIVGAAKPANQVTLVWESVSMATSYTVMRSLVSGGPYTAISTNSPNHTYVDTTVQNGVRYYYVVVASNSAGQSAFSPQMAIIPDAGVAPSAPQVTISSALMAGNSFYALGQAFMKWASVPNTQHYSVVRSNADGSGATTLNGGFTGLSLYDSSLTPGASYIYNVTATNGAGAATSSVSVTIPTQGQQGTPLNLTLSLVDGTAYLQWEQAMWTYPVLQDLFIVERSDSNGDFTYLASVAVNNLADTTAGTGNFCYQVSAGAVSNSTSSNKVCTSS